MFVWNVLLVNDLTQRDDVAQILKTSISPMTLNTVVVTGCLTGKKPYLIPIFKIICNMKLMHCSFNSLYLQ
jgi:hypothetical protein